MSNLEQHGGIQHVEVMRAVLKRTEMEQSGKALVA
jgi:hypothetical protein